MQSAKQESSESSRHGCEFCKKTFSTEKTLISHSCEPKRRWLWKDEKYIRFGFITYQKFYKISMKSKKDKTYQEFMVSKYFTSFTGFGKYLLNLNAIEPEGFIEFIIRGQHRLQDWTRSELYEEWIRELSKKEEPETAMERNILLMEQWSRENDEEWFNFFRKVETTLATKWIKTGRISPWLLYIDDQHQLFNRMSDEQLHMVKDLINPVFWKSKIKSRPNEVAFISSVLKEAGVYE